MRRLSETILVIDFPIGGFSPPEGRLARGFKPPAFSRFLFQSAVKSAESFCTRQLLAGGRLVTYHFALISPYWRGFRAVLPHAQYQHSQGAIMTKTLYA